MWDERDEEFDLRGRLARIIASKASGIHPDFMQPTKRDYAMADVFAELMEKEFQL